MKTRSKLSGPACSSKPTRCESRCFQSTTDWSSQSCKQRAGRSASIWLCVYTLASVWLAAPILNSIRSDTPAAFQYGFAISVHFSSSSHPISRPCAGSASAIPSAVKPVNTPISSTRSAFTSRTSICSRLTVSGGLMLRATGPSSHVAACNADSSGELRTPTLTRYPCSLACRPMLIDCGAELWRRLSSWAASAVSVHGAADKDTGRTAAGPRCSSELQRCQGVNFRPVLETQHPGP